MKKVVIFGSTGSIGKSALALIRKAPDKFTVLGLCAYKDIQTLKKQVKEFNPAYVCVADETAAERLEGRLDKKIKLFKGRNGLLDFAELGCDISVMGICGMACLEVLLKSINSAGRVALANKESIIGAGQFVLEAARERKTEIIPVDSEINALFQLFDGRKDDFRKVYITASGGALLNVKKNSFKNLSVEDVLAHPNWKMGRRITIDSATLVNKAFEVAETHYFFNIPYEKIEVLLHRESLIHALVEFKDNAVLACYYQPDMRVPISYALSYPQRFSCSTNSGIHRGCFSFEPLAKDKFPLFDLVLQAAMVKDNSLVVLNACDEIVISYFLEGKIKFGRIFKVMDYIACHCLRQKIKSISDVLFWDEWGRRKTKEYLGIKN